MPQALAQHPPTAAEHILEEIKEVIASNVLAPKTNDKAEGERNKALKIRNQAMKTWGKENQKEDDEEVEEKPRRKRNRRNTVEPLEYLASKRESEMELRKEELHLRKQQLELESKRQAQMQEQMLFQQRQMQQQMQLMLALVQENKKQWQLTIAVSQVQNSADGQQLFFYCVAEFCFAALSRHFLSLFGVVQFQLIHNGQLHDFSKNRTLLWKALPDGIPDFKHNPSLENFTYYHL